MQIVNVQAGSGHIVIGNIYQSPSNSKTELLIELAEFLTTVGIETEDRLVLRSDFNMPGLDSKSIDVDLSALLDMHSLLTRQPTNPPLPMHWRR